MNRRLVRWLGGVDPRSRVVEEKSHTKANASTENSQAPRGVDPDFPDESPEILDWDFSIEIKPDRPSGTVEADAEFIGRGRPIPLNDPRMRNAS